ncbi:sulfotransferase [candidate division WS5 bacterium]|uniref:Sulfotransferase n=1 Tax=candidate division WS5 bacterium TaxID=2093353 RepID=A0A419DB78_9BACT|nr:MAG: sulfotransferase [candidate division WS5 bacterium]
MFELYKPICEVGSGRSGTNFLARIVSQHEDVAFLYSPKYIWRYGNAWWPDDCLTAEHASPRVVRYIRRRFADYVSKCDKKRLFEHTQANVLALPFVNSVLPDSKIIHIIRDGRDVAASLRKMWHTKPKKQFTQRIPSRLKGVPKTDLLAYLPEFLKTMWYRTVKKQNYSFGPKIKNWQKLRDDYDILEFTAITWRECVSSAMRFGRMLPPGRYYEINFEDLFTRTDEVIDELLDFLELTHSESVRRYIHENIRPSACGRYQKDLTQDELKKILHHAGDLLKELNMI